jgi:hypothetical protein
MSGKDKTPVQRTYCQNCAYILDGLPVNRCPECGREFDPNDPRLTRLPRKKNPGIVLVMYLAPLAISALFWIPSDSTKWPGAGHGMPLEGRIILWMLQCCGPLAFILFEYQIFNLFVVTLIFSSIWGIWLVLVCATRLRNLPYVLHFFLACTWCFAGCTRAGLAVT